MKAISAKLIALMVVLSMFVVACGSPAEETKDPSDNSGEQGALAENQVITLAETSTIPGMDSTQVTDRVSFTVMNNVLEGLYRLDMENNPVPGVAESHKVSEDGLVYTFSLREDAVWSNGTPVTANDFVFAWRKALNPDTLSPYSSIFEEAGILNAVKILNNEDELHGQVDQLGVKAIDEKTLEVTLEQPIPYFLELTTFPTFYPQNEAFVTEQGDNFGQAVENLLFNGPFVLANWQHEQGWQYKKNPDYWDAEAVTLEEINVKVIKDVSTMTRLYETGEIDRTVLASEFVDQYQNHEHFGTMEEPVLFFLRFNQANEDLANVNIRKAISNAWNKEGLTNVILNNGSVPAYYFVPENFVSGPNGSDFREGQPEYHKEGTETAQEYFRKGLEELGKDSISLELLNFDSENSKTVGEYLKNQLETTLEGLTITIKPQPFAQKVELERTLDYDISFAGWGPDYPDPMTFMGMFISGGSYNNMDFSNEQYDQLIRSAQEDLSDLQQRWEDLQEAERILLEEEAAISPMYQRGVAYLQQPSVKNFIIHPVGPEKSFKWTYVEAN